MTKLYDKNGKVFNVPHAVDVKDWLESGEYSLEQIKGKKKIIAERGLSSEEANVILNSLTTKTPADEVKALAKYAGIEYTTSQDTIAEIKNKYGRK